MKEDEKILKIEDLVDRPNSGRVKKGEIGIITKETHGYPYKVDFPSQKNYYVTYTPHVNKFYELMPIEFKPEQEKLKIFPLEGCVYDSIENLDDLARYLLNRPLNKVDGKVQKSEAIGIGWNKTSCWWLKTTKSEKTQFKFQDLQYFLRNIKKTQFEKGDYVVFLGEWSGMKFINQHCYKVSKNQILLEVEIDSNSNKNSECFKVNFNITNTWRYATEEEIKHYNSIGKPFDVTTLNKKEELPEYVECIRHEKSNEYTVGKIYKVENKGVRTNQGYLGVDHLRKDLLNYYDNTDFKASTKEEYDKQELLEEPKKEEVMSIKKAFKKVEDLIYPDVIHLESQEQLDKILKYNPKLYKKLYKIFNKYMLFGNIGYTSGAGSSNIPYSTFSYNNYEFSDIIFPEEVIKEENWIPKVGDWVIVDNSKQGYDNNQLEFIGQILNYQSKSSYWIKNHNLKNYENYEEICCDSLPFRKALPHEIPNNQSTQNDQTIDIGDEVSTPDGNGIVIGIIHYDNYLIKGAHEGHKGDSGCIFIKGGPSNEKDSYFYSKDQIILVKKNIQHKNVPLNLKMSGEPGLVFVDTNMYDIKLPIISNNLQVKVRNKQINPTEVKQRVKVQLRNINKLNLKHKNYGN